MATTLTPESPPKNPPSPMELLVKNLILIPLGGTEFAL
jgi:hypothetical protein